MQLGILINAPGSHSQGSYNHVGFWILNPYPRTVTGISRKSTSPH